MPRRPPWPALAFALPLALAGCGDLASLFGPARTAQAPSQSANCDSAIQAMPRPQPVAIAGRELPAPDGPAHAFAACMRAAGWHSVEPAAPAGPVMTVASPGAAPGSPARGGRRTLGLEVTPMALSFQAPGYPRGTPGLLVMQVMPGGAAQAAGLRRGDILLGFGGTQVGAPEAMQASLARVTPGSHIATELWRDQVPMVATLAF